MATKRPHSDVHPSRREQVPQSSRKRQKPDNLGAKSFKKAHPINDLKTRARNVSRLLARTDDKLPAHIRVAKERELQTVQHELREAQAADRKSKLIARYHHIRFFERQKATRALKKAKKQLQALDEDGDVEERQTKQREIDDFELDVNYTTYYPLDRPYHSLYTREKGANIADTTASPHSERGDPEMRELVKQCMSNGRLQALRDGRLTNNDEHERPFTKARKLASHASKLSSKSKSRPTTAEEDDDNDNDDSDGGFFE